MHRTESVFFLPGHGRFVWCRLCTCVSTRQEWVETGRQKPRCPACDAPAYEARLLRPDEFAEEDVLGVPHPIRGRNAGYQKRRSNFAADDGSLSSKAANGDTAPERS